MNQLFFRRHYRNRLKTPRQLMFSISEEACRPPWMNAILFDRKLSSGGLAHVNHTYPKPEFNPKNCQNFLFPSHLEEHTTFRTH